MTSNLRWLLYRERLIHAAYFNGWLTFFYFLFGQISIVGSFIIFSVKRRLVIGSSVCAAQTKKALVSSICWHCMNKLQNIRKNASVINGLLSICGSAVFWPCNKRTTSCSQLLFISHTGRGKADSWMSGENSEGETKVQSGLKSESGLWVENERQKKANNRENIN